MLHLRRSGAPPHTDKHDNAHRAYLVRHLAVSDVLVRQAHSRVQRVGCVDDVVVALVAGAQPLLYVCTNTQKVFVRVCVVRVSHTSLKCGSGVAVRGVGFEAGVPGMES